MHENAIAVNHGYEVRSKLRGIVPSALRDCLTYQF
jgi:ribosomal protein L32E